MSRLRREDLERIFSKLDSNSDGVVSLDELNRLVDGVAGIRMSSGDLDFLAGKPSAGLNLDEFISFYDSITSSLPSSSHVRNDEDDEDVVLVTAFEVFDLNRDGFILRDELQSVLPRLGLLAGAGKDCMSLIGAFDSNSDGKLDFEEFKDMMLLTTYSSSSS